MIVESCASRPIRVLHAVPDLGFGGLQRVVSDLCAAFAGLEFENHILNFGPPDRAFAVPAAVHTVPVMSRMSWLRPAALASLVRDISPDVLHTHSGIWYKAARAGRMAGVRRIVHTEHGRKIPDPWGQRIADRLGARYTDAVIAVSEELASQLRASVVSRGAQVAVVVNGVDVERFSPGTGTLRQELDVEEQVPIIGSVGRLEPLKDYGTMIEAFAVLQASWGKGPRARLVLVGDGSVRADLERLAEMRGVRRLVTFLGWRTDTPALLRDFTVFALTSKSEGTSMSLLEAMSTGVCMVITDVGGNRAVLGPHLSHRLAPAGDVTRIAALFDAAVHDTEARARDGAAARSRVTTAFTREHAVREYAAVYRSPLSTSRQVDRSAEPGRKRIRYR